MENIFDRIVVCHVAKSWIIQWLSVAATACLLRGDRVFWTGARVPGPVGHVGFPVGALVAASDERKARSP